jgi:hypothetical protein
VQKSAPLFRWIFDDVTSKEEISTIDPIYKKETDATLSRQEIWAQEDKRSEENFSLTRVFAVPFLLTDYSWFNLCMMHV